MVSFRSTTDHGITETLQHSKSQKAGGAKMRLCVGDVVNRGGKKKGKKNPKNHGSEGTPNYIDTLYIARVIVTIIQAGTYCTELKLYGFKKLVYILSDY